MNDVALYETDGNGYSEVNDPYVFGSNVGGYKVHLVVPEPYNITAICGMTVADTHGGAFLKPQGRSHLCPKCLKEAKERKT